MNKFEFLSMNNPLRRYIQKHIEIPKLKLYSESLKGKTVLEIGCGSGYGTSLIKQNFLVKEIYGIDLDERMIAIAKQENRDQTIHFEVGDAAQLPYPDDFFDGVFDFGIIHHIPNWKNCLDELKRVLKPGGQLILEDLSTETFATPFGKFLKLVLDHPYQNMFTRNEFITYLESIGLTVMHKKVFYPLSLIQYFIVIVQK